jgi:glycosyl hydrolase family 65
MPDAKQAEKGGKDRGRDYNHSTFNDLIITGLVGLRPRMDHRLEINPLVPEGSLEYFCLDRVRYHDRDLTILYDRTGSRYGKGRGLRVYAGGREIGSAPALTALELEMPPTAGGWRK